MSSKPRLLPCPFCGMHPWRDYADHGRDSTYEVKCERCNLVMSGDYPYKVEEAWNRRVAILENKAALIAAARGLVQHFETEPGAGT